MAETQNLFKQVEDASFNVFEHVSCYSLGIHSQENGQNENFLSYLLYWVYFWGKGR
jgi:hypothetical protein